jgi:hypothetical protein
MAFVDYYDYVLNERNITVFTSGGDLDPDVFGPPGFGSGSNSQRYGRRAEEKLPHFKRKLKGLVA